METTTTGAPAPATTSTNFNFSKLPPVDYAFMYLKGDSTKRQYPKRLENFFKFIELPGKDLNEQGQHF